MLKLSKFLTQIFYYGKVIKNRILSYQEWWRDLALRNPATSSYTARC